jgi:ribosomal protein S18 acetylase RimI-like enzyme
MEIRSATAEDADRVCDHRERMFLEAGRDAAAVARMRAPFREWLLRQLERGTYRGFIAESAGRLAGSVGALEIDWAPHPMHPQQSRRGYILNMFVEPAFRRRGCARLLAAAAENDLRARGIEYAALHATDAGRPLYEALGWRATNEMSRRL